jgi:tRNA pseudouridine55 synthase
VLGRHDAYCEELRRTRIGPFKVDDADPTKVLPLEQALDFLPRVELDAEAAWRAGHGQSIPGEAEGEQVLLADAEGPVAIAEPRPDGLLKPVVGFRG